VLSLLSYHSCAYEGHNQVVAYSVHVVFLLLASRLQGPGSTSDSDELKSGKSIVPTLQSVASMYQHFYGRFRAKAGDMMMSDAIETTRYT
jgi:hypothetical protein